MNDFSKPASTRRDELAREIHGTQQLGCGCCTDYDYTQEQDKHADKLDENSRAVAIADHLLAAGWTKPRTIAEHYGDDGIENLPYRSVILSAGYASIAQSDGTWLDSYGNTYDFWEMGLPATVLWEPAL